MNTRFEMVEGNIVHAEEEAIIVPCSIKGYKGKGVDAAIYAKYPRVEENLKSWICHNKVNRTMDFGETYVVEDYGKVFILVAVPPIDKRRFYDCNLEYCYVNALIQAYEYNCNSIASPLLGTGGMKWPVGEAFFSLYDVLRDKSADAKHCKKFTLYLQDEAIVDFARKNDWNIEKCFNEEPLNFRIDYSNNGGYEIYENLYLRQWYEDKEKIKRRNKKKQMLERKTCFLFSIFAFEQLYAISRKNGIKIKEKDISQRSGINRNDISYIFTGNIRYSFDKDSAVAFGIAMECSYDQICSWLKTLGLSFNDSKRDRIIKDAFINRRYYEVKFLNEELKKNNLPELKRMTFDNAREKFVSILDKQVEYISKFSGEILTNKTIAEKSGIRPNQITEIRKGDKKFIPEKDKIIALAAALRCNIKQLEEWLTLFGFALSDSSRDCFIKKVFEERSINSAVELNSYLIKNDEDYLDVTEFKPHKDKDRDI